MRVTSRGTIFTYQNNLMKTTNQLYTAMNRYTTHRNFDSYAADPAGATRAFQIHSALNATNAQDANNKTVMGKFKTAFTSVESAMSAATKMGLESALKGLNGPDFSVESSLAQVMRSGADAMVQSLNNKYGSHYMFNGAETSEPPFAIVEDMSATLKNGNHPKVLTFRGWRVDVKEGDTEVYVDPVSGKGRNAEGEEVELDDPNAITNGDVYNKLKAMDEENLFVDVGIGFKLDNTSQAVDSATAYDSAISGIGITGFGVDKDGDPKNIISVILRMADTLEGYDNERKVWTQGTHEDASRLLDKYNAGYQKMIDEQSSISAKVSYLETNEKQLASGFDALNTELESIERVEDTEAILQLVYAMTAYQAALQVGANIVPQSLMDYMS